jgi:zinc transporter ZupT
MDAKIIIWQVIAAYAFALGGGILSASLPLSHKPLCALISFAAGTLLGVTFFSILPESLGINAWWMVVIALATGYALFFFISKFVHHVCPACAASHFDEDAARRFSQIATALIVALSIHSVTDGIALGIGREIHVASAANWSLFVALCIHKFPEGFALGSLLAGAGFPRLVALSWVAAVEAATLFGGAIGFFFLANTSIFWLGLIMAHVGGGFFYLAAHAVLGEMVRHGKRLVITSFCAGVALIGILNICLRTLTS